MRTVPATERSGPRSGKQLGRALKQLREAEGLSQQQLAESLRLADSYARTKGSKSGKARISKFENAHQIPTDDILARYAQLPGADAAELDDLARRARAERRRPGRPAAARPDGGRAGLPDALNESVGETAEPGSGRRGRHRRLAPVLGVAGAAVVGVAITAVVLVPGSTGDTAPKLSRLYVKDGKGIAVRTCPNTRCAATYLPTDTMVRMICFRDTQHVNINYSSPRWFNVRDPRTGTHGWVHSSEVGEQTHVGGC